MLTHLLIKNYALIQELELSPGSNLNIITGETGAGKSIILGALGLLMGNRADTKSLYDESEKCIVEGTFDISGFFIKHIFEEEELDFESNCLIRREISTSGKSRAFINDTPVTLETLRRIGSELMDVHSQHDNVMLGSNEYQLQLIDTYAQNAEILGKYIQQYRQYALAQQAYDKLKNEASGIKKEFDYNRFLLDELVNAKIQSGEQEQLEQELTILENAEDVKTRLQFCNEVFNSAESSVLAGLQAIVGQINPISGFSDDYKQIKDRIQTALIDLKDVAREISNEAENVELDDERILSIQERLNLLYLVQKKHGVSTNSQLIEIQENLQQKVSKVLNLDDELESYKKTLETSKINLEKIGEKLSVSRLKIIQQLEKQLMDLLKELGILNATLVIKHQITKPTMSGFDEVSFNFSANKGVQPQQLKMVASGGEFSRLMLALKYLLADKRSLPTIVFDEIDTGISGEIAIKVGNMMREMAQSHQVLAITHLHQIAGKGNKHYYVYKDHSAQKTVSRLRELNIDERVLEIAKMIGGEKPTESAMLSARELLEVR
jgi:DNA repair protein RecN (Recombination protein N)